MLPSSSPQKFVHVCFQVWRLVCAFGQTNALRKKKKKKNYIIFLYFMFLMTQCLFGLTKRKGRLEQNYSFLCTFMVVLTFACNFIPKPLSIKHMHGFTISVVCPLT